VKKVNLELKQIRNNLDLLLNPIFELKIRYVCEMDFVRIRDNLIRLRDFENNGEIDKIKEAKQNYNNYLSCLKEKCKETYERLCLDFI